MMILYLLKVWYKINKWPRLFRAHVYLKLNDPIFKMAKPKPKFLKTIKTLCLAKTHIGSLFSSKKTTESLVNWLCKNPLNVKRNEFSVLALKLVGDPYSISLDMYNKSYTTTI